MAAEPDNIVLRLLREIRAAQQAQGETLGQHSGALTRLEKRVEDLYTMSPNGSLYFAGGWNRAALIALAGAGFVSIGLSLFGAYGVIPNIGDWGWLIGAALGAVLYTTLMRREAPSLSRPDGVVA